jgi:hypothetical protein
MVDNGYFIFIFIFYWLQNMSFVLHPTHSLLNGSQVVWLRGFDELIQ